jgi:hypothetical protein
MIIYLHSSNMDDAGVTFGRHARTPASEIAHVLVPSTVPHSVTQVVDMIKRAAVNRGAIHLLIINCHGFLVGEPPAFWGLEIDVGLWTADNIGAFRDLATWFSPGNQGIEIHSCAAARGVEGRHFCQTLANHSGVNVFAGIQLQAGAPPPGSDPSGYWIAEHFGLEGAPDAWGYYEGPALQFTPNTITPHDGSAELMARGAWRVGTAAVPTPHEVDLYELNHPVHINH